mmetsp:Transcript_15704/g.26177  ORF Transcript_15704/g.26177 Transcript_15704/m.26177 type:complete len:331 (-) Transcript_15704:627-1619(-)
MPRFINVILYCLYLNFKQETLHDQEASLHFIQLLGVLTWQIQPERSLLSALLLLEQPGPMHANVVLHQDPELIEGAGVHVAPSLMNLEHLALPRQDVLRHFAAVVQAHMDAQRLVENIDGVGVQPALELPRLSLHEHNHHALPLVCRQLPAIVHDLELHNLAVLASVGEALSVRAALETSLAALVAGHEVSVSQELSGIEPREGGGERIRHDEDGGARHGCRGGRGPARRGAPGPAGAGAGALGRDISFVLGPPLLARLVLARVFASRRLALLRASLLCLQHMVVDELQHETEIPARLAHHRIAVGGGELVRAQRREKRLIRLYEALLLR